MEIFTPGKVRHHERREEKGGRKNLPAVRSSHGAEREASNAEKGAGRISSKGEAQPKRLPVVVPSWRGETDRNYPLKKKREGGTPSGRSVRFGRVGTVYGREEGRAR